MKTGGIFAVEVPDRQEKKRFGSAEIPPTTEE
jgi:hypothetical protein